MKTKIAKLICIGLALATPLSASADVFTLDRNSGQLYKVDASNYIVTPIGAPLDASFLSSLTKHSNGQYPNIDITYLDGYIYGLVGNARPNDPAMLFRLNELGALDMGFGNSGVKTISLLDQSPFMGSVEGLASNGTNLLIGHSAQEESTPLSSMISVYNVNTNTTLSTSSVGSFSGAPSSYALTDMDGLGALNARAMSVDSRNPASHIISLGQLPTGTFNDIYNISPGAFEDVAFVDEDKFVVAGDYTVNGTRRNGLHFFSTIGGQTTYLTSAQFPGETGIYSVASTTENDDVVPPDYNPDLPIGEIGDKPVTNIFDPFPIVPNGEHYQCYMLEKSDNIKAEEITIQDQFGTSRVVLGRPIIICNPSMKIHNKQQFNIQDEERHLVCYNYEKQDRVERHDLRINTQFGKDTVTSSRRELFCAPAGKNHVKR